jgi:Sporulation and spore germination.
MKRITKAIAALLVCALALAGCGTARPDGSANMPDINPNAEAANKDTLDIALYFCYSGESLLAAETRTIDVPVSATLENAVVRALIAGPSAGQNELSGLFWEGVVLIGTSTNEDILFVTLSKEFISTQPGGDELVLGSGSAAEQKLLAIESIVSTIVEMGTYSRVQIQVEGGSGSRRITEAEAGKDESSTEPLEPLGRNKLLILTPENTLAQALDAINKKDWARLYNFTAYTSPDGTQKPDSDVFSETLSGPGNVLETYSIVDSNVSYDGQTAVVLLNYAIKKREGDPVERPNVPVTLVRESYIWKVSYISILNILVTVG